MTRRYGAERLRPRLGSWLVLAAVLAVAGAFTLWETRDQALYADELAMFASYGGWDPATLFRSQGGHLILTSLTVYKGIWEVFGADSHLPLRIYHVVLVLISAVLVYLLARRAIGDWAAIAPAALLLFLGSANELTATPFGALAYIAIALGLGMFLALERDDTAGDVAAAVLLAAGLASYSIILAFAAGAAVTIWLRGPGRRWRAAWVIGVPIAGYLLWRQLGLDAGETNISLGNIGNLPASIFALAAAASASLTGLFRVPGQGGAATTLDWGYPLAVAGALLVVLRLRLGPPPSARFWAYAVTLLVFWALVAVNLGPLRSPDASRYQYISVLFILLAGAELAAGVRWPRWSMVAVGALLAGSLLTNALTLHQTSPIYRTSANVLRATLTATEIAGPAADPGAELIVLPDVPVVRDLRIRTVEYLEAVDEYGSPSWSEAELAAAPATPRAAADLQLLRLLEVAPAPAASVAAGAASPLRGARVESGSILRRAPCLVAAPPTGGELTVTFRVPTGGAAVAALDSPAGLSVGRFADGAPVALRGVAADSASSLRIPPDRSARPWRLRVSSTGRIRACGLEPS